MVVSKNGRFIIENPLKWMIWGYPYFRKPLYIYIWANYNNSLTWIKAIWGWFPLLTMIPVRSQWGRYNLPRYICITSSWVYKLITGRNTTLWDLSKRTFLYLGFSWGKEPCFCGTIVIFVLFGSGNDDKHWHFKLMKIIGNRIEWLFMMFLWQCRSSFK